MKLNFLFFLSVCLIFSSLVSCQTGSTEWIDTSSKTKFDFRDIQAKFTLNIPQDDVLTAQVLSQMGIGENISLDTALAQLSFVNNVEREKNLIKKNKEEIADEIDLDKVNTHTETVIEEGAEDER